MARSALGDDGKFFKLMADVKIQTTLSEAPVEKLQALLQAVSREVERQRAK